MLNLPFVDKIGRPDRDNTIDVYISDDYMDVLADGIWENFFTEKPEPTLRLLPVYLQPASAGTGQWLDDDAQEMTEVDESVPAKAEFGVRIAGDSMEPRFVNGQTVWVSQQHSLMTGEIGIFLYDGCAYLKQLVAGDGYLALHSLNPAYPDIRISPALPLRVLGKVLAA